MNRKYTFALYASLRLGGWLPTSLCAVGILVFGLLNATLWRDGISPVPAARVVEIIVPLAAGIQAAFLLSPEDEPCLEVLLVCPRPVRWALLERMLVMAALTGGVALGGSLIQPEGAALAVARWAAPVAWFCGVAVFAGLLTRQGVLGALLATLLWGGTLFGGDALLARWPYLWPLHAYLQPGDTSSIRYALNRSLLILAGLILAGFAAHLAGDAERMLGIRSHKRANVSPTGFWKRVRCSS
ncbi:MAG: hypothetical protein JW934_08770 [Anaerolineae bacterium]|nr:hypothetical protein [Anaerolineae bacterium]